MYFDIQVDFKGHNFTYSSLIQSDAPTFQEIIDLTTTSPPHLAIKPIEDKKNIHFEN